MAEQSTAKDPAKTLTDMVASARAEAEQQAAALEAERAKQVDAAYAATVERLKGLLAAELNIADGAEVIRYHKNYSHGSPATDYALVKLGEYWLGVQVVDPRSLDQIPLVALVHCPNGHVISQEYPVTESDTWAKTLLKVADAQKLYEDPINCGVCGTERAQVRQYRPPRIMPSRG